MRAEHEIVVRNFAIGLKLFGCWCVFESTSFFAVEVDKGPLWR